MFLYFLPTQLKVAPISPAGWTRLLTDAGAAHLLGANLQMPACVVAKGPGDEPGVVFMPHLRGSLEQTPSVKYQPESQTWRKSHAGTFWIGTATGQPMPGPDELRREKIIDGHEVELLDGKRWMIPVARSFPSGTRLPQRLKLSADGKVWEFHELEQFAPICRDAERIVDLFKAWAQQATDDPPADDDSSDDGTWIDDQEAMRIVVAALAINYRLSAIEIDMLGLIGTDQMGEVCRALIDYPTWVSITRDRSKNEPAPASLPIDSGSPGDSTDTSQHS